jgi:hypothetical protein
VSSPVLLARELRWQTRLALSRGQGSDLTSVTLRAPQTLRRDVAFGDAFEGWNFFSLRRIWYWS